MLTYDGLSVQTTITTLPDNWIVHLKPGATDATLLNVTCCAICTTCWMLLRVVGSCSAKFETSQTFSYRQTDATTPNNFGSFWPTMLLSFAPDLNFRLVTITCIKILEGVGKARKLPSISLIDKCWRKVMRECCVCFPTATKRLIRKLQPRMLSIHLAQLFVVYIYLSNATAWLHNRHQHKVSSYTVIWHNIPSNNNRNFAVRNVYETQSRSRA